VLGSGLARWLSTRLRAVRTVRTHAGLTRNGLAHSRHARLRRTWSRCILPCSHTTGAHRCGLVDVVSEKHRPEWCDEDTKHGVSSSSAVLGVDAVHRDNQENEWHDAEADKRQQHDPAWQASALEQLPLVPDRNPAVSTFQTNARKEPRHRPQIPNNNAHGEQQPNDRNDHYSYGGSRP
jgi:hypothetical protein